MKSSLKISILVSIQIVLILGSFLVLAYLETTKALHGNLVNVSGKNRFLASEIKNEINHVVFHISTNVELTSINLLRENLLFLKNGGTSQEIELDPLNSKYDPDWEVLWAQYVQLDRALRLISIEDVNAVPIDDVEKIEQLADSLVEDSDVLTNKIGKDLETLSDNLFLLEILLGSVNIVVHVFMIIYIISIFKKESEERVKNERFASIGEFASNIAHDIKNPLAVITNSLQIIQRSLPSPKSDTRNDLIKKEIEHIFVSVKRIDHQVEEVLNYVKNVPMSTSENSLLAVLKDAKETVIAPSNIQIELPTNDIKIICDENQIHVVFVNLFRNAIQAISSDMGTIRVKIMDLKDEVQIDIANSGPPISKKELPNLFEPLFTNKMEGTGLGLTSCKNIITRHNGTIHVSSEPVVFTIKLPKKQDSE